MSELLVVVWAAVLLAEDEAVALLNWAVVMTGVMSSLAGLEMEPTETMAGSFWMLAESCSLVCWLVLSSEPVSLMVLRPDLMVDSDLTGQALAGWGVSLLLAA